jgi:hypothetical protein
MSLTTRLWFRRTVLTAGALVLLVLVAVPSVQLYASSRYERALAEAGPLELDPAAFEKPEVPEHENAAAWIEAGAAALLLSSEEMELRSRLNQSGPANTWESGQLDQARAILERYSGGLETLHQAADLEKSSYGIRYRDGLKAETPDLLSILHGARLLLLDARVAMADGDEARLLQSLAAMSTIAESLEEESTLITALVGIACERMLLVAMGEAVAAPEPWAEQVEYLERLESMVPAQSREEMLTRTLNAWTAIMLMEQPFSDKPTLGERRNDEPIYLKPFRDLARLDVLRARRTFEDRLGIPFARSPQLFEVPDPPKVMSSFKRAFFDDEWGFVRALTRAQSIAAQRQMIRAAIAVRAAGAEIGAYPLDRPEIEELNEPDPFTDRPLAYRALDDGSVEIGLDNATELLEQTILASAARSVVPVVLPAPGS